jgi:uncharacterized membrane protein
MPALARLSPSAGIAAMQAINVAAYGRWFMGALLGTAVACTALAITSILRWSETGAGLRLAGSVLYVVAAIVVTKAFNVPRNDALAALAPDAASAAEAWRSYVPAWCAWNHVRAAGSLAGSALLVVSLLDLVPTLVGTSSPSSAEPMRGPPAI